MKHLKYVWVGAKAVFEALSFIFVFLALFAIAFGFVGPWTLGWNWPWGVASDSVMVIGLLYFIGRETSA